MRLTISPVKIEKYRLDEILISVMYLMYSYILDNDWTVDDEQTFHQIGL